MSTNNQIDVGLSGVTGTGTFVGSTSPTFVTPTLGAALATSINFGGSSLANYVSGGTFLPTLSFATPGDLSVVYGTQEGVYTRIGNVVNFSIIMACTPTFTTASGAMLVLSLPVAVSASSDTFGTLVLGSNNFLLGVGATSLCCEIFFSSVSKIVFGQSGSMVGYSNLTPSAISSGAQITFYMSGFYYA